MAQRVFAMLEKFGLYPFDSSRSTAYLIRAFYAISRDSSDSDDPGLDELEEPSSDWLLRSSFDSRDRLLADFGESEELVPYP